MLEKQVKSSINSQFSLQKDVNEKRQEKHKERLSNDFNFFVFFERVDIHLFPNRIVRCLIRFVLFSARFFDTNIEIISIFLLNFMLKFSTQKSIFKKYPSPHFACNHLIINILNKVLKNHNYTFFL